MNPSGSGACMRSRVWPVSAGCRRWVALLTTSTTTNATGTVINAGCCTNPGAQSPVYRLITSATIAAITSPPPTIMPAPAPTHVSLRHQMPSTSTGQNVDAANANVTPMLSDTSFGRSNNASASGIVPAMIAAHRKSRTRPGSTSVDSTPDTLTTSPDDVDRNAANAPAEVTAPRIWPATPGTIFCGNASAAASVLPVTSSSGV